MLENSRTGSSSVQHFGCVVLSLIGLLIQSSAQAINVKLDYTYDTGNFFGAGNPDGFTAGMQARAALEEAANFYSDLLADDFSKIETPPQFDSSVFNGTVTWEWKANFTDPSTGLLRTLTDEIIAEDEYRIYAGARNLDGNTLGIGGPGGFSWSSSPSGFFMGDEIDEIDQITANFSDIVEMRGEPIGFSRWGGVIAVDSVGTTWSYNHNLLPLGNQNDFISVVYHELGHALGLGASQEWSDLITGSSFIGLAATSEFGGAVPLACAFNDCPHLAQGTESITYLTGVSQEAAMAPTVNVGDREVFTRLDVATLIDIGWDVLVLTQDHTWDTVVTTGAWENPANWNPQGVPYSNWNAQLDNHIVATGQSAVVSGDLAVNSITVTGSVYPMTLAINRGATLTTITGMTLNTGAFVTGGGTVNGGLRNNGGHAIGAVETLNVNGPVTLNNVSLAVSDSYTQTRATNTGVFRMLTAAGGISGLFSTPAASGASSHLGNGYFLSGISQSGTHVDVDILAALEGDSDGDRDIDITDFSNLVVNFDPNGLNPEIDWTFADFDQDADVDITDFNLLVLNFAPIEYGAGAAPIPEPNSFNLLIGAISCVVLLSRQIGMR